MSSLRSLPIQQTNPTTAGELTRLARRAHRVVVPAAPDDRSPSQRTLCGIDGLNFFVADVQTGVGPVLAIDRAAYTASRALAIAVLRPYASEARERRELPASTATTGERAA